MFLGYGYGYPRSLILGGSGNPYWAAYNVRASADGATAAETASNDCLQARFIATFQNYNFFVWTDTVWAVFNSRCDAQHHLYSLSPIVPRRGNYTPKSQPAGRGTSPLLATRLRQGLPRQGYWNP
jgi:hypothetical protein